MDAVSYTLLTLKICCKRYGFVGVHNNIINGDDNDDYNRSNKHGAGASRSPRHWRQRCGKGRAFCTLCSVWSRIYSVCRAAPKLVWRLCTILPFRHFVNSEKLMGCPGTHAWCGCPRCCHQQARQLYVCSCAQSRWRHIGRRKPKG